MMVTGSGLEVIPDHHKADAVAALLAALGFPFHARRGVSLAIQAPTPQRADLDYQ